MMKEDQSNSYTLFFDGCSKEIQARRVPAQLFTETRLKFIVNLVLLGIKLPIM